MDDAGNRSSSLLLLLFLLLLFLFASLPPPVQGGGSGDGGEEAAAGAARNSEGQQEPQMAERAIGLTGADFASRWEALKGWAKLTLMNLKSPDSMIRNERSESINTGEVVRQAATRSIEESKETVEKSAMSVAKAAEMAVQKTKETAMRITTGAPAPEEKIVPDAEL